MTNDALITSEDLIAGVRSFAPGRLRLRLSLLRGLTEDDMTMLEAGVRSLGEFETVQCNPRVGSLLLTWDEAQHRLDLEKLAQGAADLLAFLPPADVPTDETPDDATPCAAQAAAAALTRAADGVESALGGVFERAGALIAADVHKGARRKRVAQNRLMLASFAATLLVLATKSRAAHTAAGVVFTAFLALHLWQHRRVL